MIYFLALIPKTALTIGGYCALFLSNRSEGAFPGRRYQSRSSAGSRIAAPAIAD
jgi:hypothetical protein